MQKGLRPNNLKFFDGAQNFDENNAVPANKLYRTRNVRFNARVITTKKGYQAIGDLLVGGTSGQGLNQLSLTAAGVTTVTLVGVYNSTLYEFDEGTQTWTPVVTVWPNVADSFTDSVQYYQSLYLVNPLTSGSTGGIGKYDGTTFSVISTAPNGIAIESWAERLWIIDPNLPVVRASRAATVSNPTYVEDWTTGTIQELIGKEGLCTAIRVLDNQLFVWKKDGIYTNTIDRLAAGTSAFYELSRTGGAVNQKSTTRVENDIWFLTPSNEIRSLGIERNFQANNQRTRELSSIIKRSMDLLDPVQDDPVMTYNKRIVKLHLKTRGAATNNFTVVFDYDTGGFEIDIGQTVHVANTFKNDIYYWETNTGQLYQDEIGNSAGGLSFLAQADTPFMDDNRPDTSKRARYLFWRGKLSYDQELTLKLYRDGNYDTYTSYTIPSPADDGVSPVSVDDEGEWGNATWGSELWGGEGQSGGDITLYQREKLISISQRSNMFAIGMEAQIDGGKAQTEQLILKVIDDNENYRRSNI